jgi:hypothetical protein
VLVKVPALTVTLASALFMAVTTYAMLQLKSQTAVTIAVFGDVFPRGAGTAIEIAITFGWIGLAISSPIIGRITAGSTLQKALLVLPIFSVVMILVNLVLRPR